jgi:hypothetical protein
MVGAGLCMFGAWKPFGSKGTLFGDLVVLGRMYWVPELALYGRGESYRPVRQALARQS